MKRKSDRFKLAFVPAVSAAMLAFGCGGPHDSSWSSGNDAAARVCVDREGRRVANDQCRDERRTGGGYFPFYTWYYLSRGGAIPHVGQTASGGSFSAAAADPVSRGGFGRSAHGAGGGAGE